MSTIQNLKNFIRHGKQAKQQPVEPVTTVNPVHAQPYKYGVTEPNMNAQSKNLPHSHAHVENSAANIDNRNHAAQAGGMAAQHAADKQKLEQGNTKQKDYDPAILERMVAEERESKGKLPRYPGLDRYKLIEKMGDGAFSNVYRAQDLEGDHGEVAIKVVRKFEMNSSQRANILKEVQIMRQLDHPNIVRLLGFSESTQYYFIILELCPGGELFHQIVRLTYFSEDLSRHVITQVAKALDYLHEEKGVVHRDIKPENLLFYPVPFIATKNPKPKGPEDEDKADEGEFIQGVGAGGIGRIKIADFGLSKVVWDSQTMTPCGTVGYTAPEIVKDERYSKSVDMWALGCVLYTLLCGFPPFYDESIQVLTEKVARGQYTFLSPWWDDISKSAQDLVSHLLTVDPDKRYTITEFLNHPWIRNSNEETTAAFDAPPLATPLWQRQKALAGTSAGQEAMSAQWLETPGGHVRPMDFRSPGAVNLREVFDVGYAVHRQEEEAKRRKVVGTGNGFSNLNALDEEEDDTSDVQQKLRSTNLNTTSAAAQARAQAAPATTKRAAAQPEPRGYGQHSAAVTAAAKAQVRKQKGPFELSLDNATLLGRRKGPVGVEPSKLREQLV